MFSELSVGFFRRERWAISAGAVLLLLLPAAGPVLALDMPHYITRCDSCTKQIHYAFAAADKVPSPSPHIKTAVTWSVYVANVEQDQVHSFLVVVQPLNDGDGPPPGSPGINSQVYEFGPHKKVYPVDGNPTVKSAVLDGMNAAIAFAGMLGGSLSDVDIPTDVGSAIDVVGPEDSPAGYNRRRLAMGINDHYATIWSDLRTPLSNLSSRLMGRFVGDDANVTFQKVIEITFKDGTSIKIKVDEILTGFDGSSDLHLELTVLEHTARLPGGEPVPTSAGEFGGFHWNDGPGTNVGAQLALLAGLYGLDVGGQGMDCTFECNGSRCTLTCR